MPELNLLPWREQYRRQLKQQLCLLLLLSIASALILLWLRHMVICNRVQQQVARNQFLQSQIEAIEPQLAALESLQQHKQRLLTHLATLIRLHQHIQTTLYLFNALSQLPEGILIEKIERQDQHLILTGHAISNTLITRLLQDLAQMQWLTEPQLTEMNQSNPQPFYRYNFRLEFKQRILAY